MYLCQAGSAVDYNLPPSLPLNPLSLQVALKVLDGQIWKGKPITAKASFKVATPSKMHKNACFFVPGGSTVSGSTL